jgi:RNA polymerase sigma-70 factor, ECF subfamily
MTYEDRIIVAVAMGRSRGAEQEDVIALLVRKHATFVYRVAYSVLHDAHDAEDIAQEAFIRVMNKTSQLPLIRDQRAWLARIAWRLAITKLNRTRKRRRVEIEIPEDLAGNFDADDKEFIEAVNRLTLLLPEDLRSTLVLSAIEELSSKEVAEVLEISETTVRTRIHRARRLLREKLSKWKRGTAR